MARIHKLVLWSSIGLLVLAIMQGLGNMGMLIALAAISILYAISHATEAVYYSLAERMDHYLKPKPLDDDDD